MPRNCVGTNFAEDFGQSLAALSDIGGGVPSDNAMRLRTPGIACLSNTPCLANARGRRQVFQEERPSRRSVAELTGRDGTLSIEATDPEVALAEIAATLAAMDMDSKYRMAPTINWVASGYTAGTNADLRPPATPFARRLLAPFLAAILQDRQLTLARELFDRASLPYDTSLPLRDVLADLRCEDIPGLQDAEMDILRRLCLHRPVNGMGALRAYFLRAGGLLRVSQYGSFEESDLRENQLQIQLANLERATNGIRVDVQAVANLVHAGFTDQARARLQDAVDQLQNSLGLAVTKMEEAREATRGNIFELAIAKGKALANDVTELKAAYATADTPEGYAKAGPAAYRVATGLIGFLSGADLEASKQKLTAAEIDVANLREVLAKAQRAYSELERDAAIEREQMLAKRLATLNDLFAADHSIEAIKMGVLLRFEDMVRSALVAYVADRAVPDGNLRAHARALREVLENFPRRTSLPLAGLGADGCAGQNAVPFEQVPRSALAECVSFRTRPARAAFP
jgi:hypothetical protein